MIVASELQMNEEKASDSRPRQNANTCAENILMMMMCYLYTSHPLSVQTASSWIINFSWIQSHVQG